MINLSLNFQVGSASHFPTLMKRIKSCPNTLIPDGEIDIIEENKGKYRFLTLNIRDGHPEEETGVLFIYKLSKLLTEVILDNWEFQIVYQIIKDQYYYLKEEEKNKVLLRTFNLLENSQDIYNKTIRWQRVLKKTQEYLEQNNSINLEGFINFRLKEYRNILGEAVDQAVDEFIMEREYDEFVRLLKYFVDIQDPRVDTVNVLLKKSGVFELYDGNREPIDNDYLEGFILEFIDNEINYEDLLISALITIAPRRVILHFPDQRTVRDAIKTIKNVFGDRAEECSGCQFCNEHGQRNN